MLRKSLAWLLTIMMVISMFPISVFATDDTGNTPNIEFIDNSLEEPANEADVNDVSGESGNNVIDTEAELKAAIEAGGEVVLGGNIELSETLTIPAGKVVTLDLAGCKISQTKEQTAGYQMILNDGNLTITDTSSGKTGKISYTDSGNGGEYISDTIYNRGTLVIKGGTIENLSSATVAANGYPHAVDTYSGIRDTSVTINGGTIYCKEYSAIRMFCVSATYKADLVINNGATIKGAVDMQNGTKDAALGSLTINGGTFEITKNENNIRFANWNGGATGYGITASIEGGTFKGGISTQYVPDAANWNSKIITGGTFGSDISAYLAEGIMVEQIDGKYVTNTNPAYGKVAMIGDTYYGTFADALAAAIEIDSSDTTIKLLQDVKLTGKLTLAKSITIDGNGYSIIADETAVWYTVSGKYNIKNYNTHLIGVNADGITLKNIVLDCNNNAAGINIYCAQNVVFDKVSVINATKGTAGITVNGSTLTVKTSLTVLCNSTALDISNGKDVTSALGVTVEDGTVFNLDNKTVKFASVADVDFSGAVSTDGNPYFAAKDNAYYYTLAQMESRIAAYSNGLTLLADVTVDGNIKIKGTLNLNGHKLTVAEDRQFETTGGLTIAGEGSLAGNIVLTGGDIVLTSATATITAPAGLNVTTNVEGYYALYKEGVYKLAEIKLPNAEVNNLGSINVTNGSNADETHFKGDYYIYDLINGSGLTTGTAPFDLTLAMQFIANDTYEQAKLNYYADYTTDFFIQMTGMENVTSIKADGCYIAGYYPSFGAWVVIPLDDFEIENGAVYPVITSANFDFKYVDICYAVENFVCGIYLTPEVLEANPDLKVTLTLGLSENVDRALAGKFVTVESYEYDAAVLAPKKYVAQIGTTRFENLQAAINAAQNGDTIVILDNIALSESVTIPAGKEVTLDLNGKTVVYNSTVQNEAMITNNGTLTINDTVGGGVINYNYTGAADPTYGKGNYTIKNCGTLTVNGGKITIANLSGHAKYPIDNNSTTGNAILVINGGHLYNYNTSAIRQFCNSATYKNSVTINGGIIEGYCAIWVQNPGSGTVNAKLTITGGEIKSTAKAYVEGTTALKDVSSAIYFTVNGNGGAWSEDSFVSITGGTFNENVYLVERAPVATIGTGATFNGYVQLPVASINGFGYATLAEAFAAANAGETITLLTDIDLSESVTIPAGKTIILDLNGKTITGTDNATVSFGLINLVPGAELTINDTVGTGKITLTATNDRDWNSYSSVISVQRAKLTVKGGTIEHLGGTDMAYAIDVLTNTGAQNAEAVINGGTIKSTYRAIRQFANSTTGKTILTVNGGTIEGANKSIWAQNANSNNNPNELTVSANAKLNGDVLLSGSNATAWNLELSVDATALQGSSTVTGSKLPTTMAVNKQNGVWGITAAVASINGFGYATLAEAFAAAQDEETIKLLQNIAMDAGIINTKKVTLDLNGKTISTTITEKLTKSFALITNKGTLTVTDSAKDGKLSVNYTNESFGYGVGLYAISNEGGTLNINGGRIENLATVTGSMYDAIDNNSTLGNTYLNISGGEIYCGYLGIRQFANSTSYANTVTITGGKVEGGNSAIWTQNPGSNQPKANIAISDGTITGRILLGESEAFAVAVRGGTFTVAVPEEYCEAGYIPTANNNGTYGVKAGKYVVRNTTTGVGYETLAEAWAAAQDGDTIVLLADVALNGSITNNKKVTLDLNGKTITGTDKATGSFSLIENKGELTITGNGKITLVATNDRDWNAYSSVISNTVGGKLTVKNGTIEHLGGTDMAYGIDNLTNGKGTYAETIINGGTIKSTYRAIRQFLNGVEAQNILTVNGGTIEGANKSIWMQDPSTKANTGKLTVAKDAVINGDIYLYVTEGSTEWPVEVSIAIDALNNGSTVVTGNVPNGYITGETNGNGIYGVSKDSTKLYIYTLADLIAFRDAVNNGNSFAGVTVYLAADIDLTSIENWEPIGTFDCSFDGNFNGQGHKIMNLKMSDNTAANGEAYLGFFGITANNTIENFVIENVTINSNGQIVAAAIAYPYYTTVKNITVCGDIAITGGNYTAGVLAYTRLCQNASNLTVSGNAGSYITGVLVVGGVIADIQMNKGLVANYSNFSASGLTITGTKMVGGISGIIATQTLNGATVKNVTLESGDNRVGIVAGSLGGTSTISNVTVENVTGATAVVGAAYDSDYLVVKNGDVYTAVPSVAEVNGVKYATLQEALKVAEEAAETGAVTVTLLADLTKENKNDVQLVLVPANVTFDLNGHKLETSYFIGVNDSQVKDSKQVASPNHNAGDLSSAGSGRIIASYITLDKNNNQLPIKTGDEYAFVSPFILVRDKILGEENVTRFELKPSVASLNNEFQNGMSDNRLKFVIRLEWTNAAGNMISQDFKYTDDLISNAFTNKHMLKFSATGLGRYKDMTIKILLISETGVEFCYNEIFEIPYEGTTAIEK